MAEPRHSKILIVDDEPLNVRVLEVRLKAEGYDVLMAENGDEALRKTHEESPDLILLDIMMPGKNGYQVCEELRANEATRFIPIIMLTALAEREDRLRGLDAGADDFITKPPDRVELATRVRSLLRIKHFQDDLTRLNSELELRNEMMQQDLLMAREVQQQLLPHDVADLPDFHVVYRYVPESQVGGDFVEIASLPSGQLGVFIADVMGHGAQAALVTVLLKTAISEWQESTEAPEQILMGLNQRFVRLLSGKILTYASGCYFRADAERQTLVYSNAGHPFPLLLNRTDGSCTELSAAGHGTGIGLLPGADYSAAEHPFRPGDVLLFFTDGIYEAMNPDGDMYGLERMQTLLRDLREESLERMIESLLADVHRFAGTRPLEDDITLVGLEVRR